MREVKDARRKINGMLEILRHIAGGQGYAGISTFDPGSGGDATFSIQVNLERDGLTFSRKEVERGEIVSVLEQFCGNKFR